MKKQSPLRNRVKELRARLGIRQADLAREVGITRQTIIAIEKGRLNPSILICLKIARLLREPVDYIFYLAAGWDSVDGVVAEPPPQASTRVRVPSKKRKAPSVQGAEPAPATPERYNLDRDTGADTVDETADEPVPESVTAEAKPEPKAEPKQDEKSERKAETEEPATETEKQGQAIWDFF